jgi:hypothetical protein
LIFEKLSNIKIILDFGILDLDFSGFSHSGFEHSGFLPPPQFERSLLILLRKNVFLFFEMVLDLILQLLVFSQ